MKYKKIHNWKIAKKEAIKIQILLQKHIKICPLKKVSSLAAADVAYLPKLHKAIAVVLIFSYPELKLVRKYYQINPVEELSLSNFSNKPTKLSTKIQTCSKDYNDVRYIYPYVSGLLAFREGPLLLNVFKKIEEKIDVIIFDGHGINHPRFMGLATHMGILLDIPTIGCAKTPLIKYIHKPKNKFMNYKIINYKNKEVGIILRSKVNTKPIFISPGYKIDINSCLYIIKNCLKKYRIPQPLRKAHYISKQLKEKFGH